MHLSKTFHTFFIATFLFFIHTLSLFFHSCLVFNLNIPPYSPFHSPCSSFFLLSPTLFLFYPSFLSPPFSPLFTLSHSNTSIFLLLTLLSILLTLSFPFLTRSSHVSLFSPLFSYTYQNITDEDQIVSKC